MIAPKLIIGGVEFALQTFPVTQDYSRVDGGSVLHRALNGAGLPRARAMVAGAVAGGGLTVNANAPNPAGVALLKRGFADETVGAGGLLLGALGPTAVAALAFLLL